MALGRSSSPKSCTGSVKSFRSSGKSHSSGNSQLSTSSRLRYKGLFTSDDAPSSRAYCILLSFFTGVLLITIGSVFIRVKLIHPMSGIHPMHTPPWPLALGLIGAGILTVLTSCGTAYRYGFDDGDDSLLEEDNYSFARDDILNRQSSPKKEYYDNRAYSTPHPQAFARDDIPNRQSSPKKEYYDNRAYSTPHPQAYPKQLPQNNAQSYKDLQSQCQEQSESVHQSCDSLYSSQLQKPQPLHYFSNISIYPTNDDYSSPRVNNFINNQMQESSHIGTTGSCIQLNGQNSFSPNSSCLNFHDQHSISPNSSCLQFNDQTTISPNSSCHQLYVQRLISPKGVRFQDQVSLSPNSSCHQLYDQNSLSPNSSILKFPVQDSLSPNNSGLKINIQSSPVTYSNIFLHNKEQRSPGKAVTQIYIGTPDNSQLSCV